MEVTSLEQLYKVFRRTYGQGGCLQRIVGVTVGGLTGALVGFGIPEHEAKRYEGKGKEDGILISVHSESKDETTRARNIFKEEVHDISSTGEAHSDMTAEDVLETAATRAREVTPRSELSESAMIGVPVL